jgi:hypothetical protein
VHASLENDISLENLDLHGCWDPFPSNGEPLWPTYVGLRLSDELPWPRDDESPWSSNDRPEFWPSSEGNRPEIQVSIELPSSDDIFSEEGAIRHTAPDLQGHLQTPTQPEARDPNSIMDLNNRSPRYNTGNTFLLNMRAPPYLLTHILNSFNTIGQSLGFHPGSFRLRIGDASDQVISELMDQQAMSNSPILEKRNVFMDVTAEVWVDCPWAEMLLAGNKGVTEADTHPRYFRNSLKKLARMWKIFTSVPPRDLPHVTLLLGNPIKVDKYLPMGNVRDFNLRRIHTIHCISAGTMAEKSEKPNIKRSTLEKHNMTQYDIGEVEFPSHVHAVQEGLLEFNIALNQASTGQFLKMNGFKKDSFEEIPHSVFIGRSLSEDEKNTMTRYFKLASQLAKDAQKLEKDGALENRWTALLNEFVFRGFEHAARGQTGFSKESDILWTEAHRNARTFNPSTCQPTIPKPDIYLGFPIYQDSKKKGFARVSHVEDFSTRSLKILLENDVVCSPTSAFRNWIYDGEKSPLEKHHLICFPWVIVELKRQNVPEPQKEYGECQGVNASSTALSMLEQLYKPYKSSDYSADQIPPVVVFTLVGGKAKLWLAYSSPAENNSTTHVRTSLLPF